MCNPRLIYFHFFEVVGQVDDRPHAGDIGYVFNFTLKSYTNGVASADNLTGATVTILVTKGDGTTATWAATITDAANGKCSYTTVNGDLVAGQLRMQPKAVWVSVTRYYDAVLETVDS